MSSGTLVPFDAGCGPTPTQKYVSVSKFFILYIKIGAKFIFILTFSTAIVAEALDSDGFRVDDLDGI